MKKIFLGRFFLFSFLSLSQLIVQSQDRTVRFGRPGDSKGPVKLTGKIIDEEKLPLQGTTVLINGINKGVATDAEGKFSFELAPGVYTMVINRVGKKRQIKIIQIYRDGYMVVLMENEVLNLNEVVIEGDQDKNVQSVVTGSSTLEIKEIERIPAFLGEVDVVKSLQLLPGVSTVGEGASGFNVRGGRTDQNLVLVNNTPIFNSSHVLGFFSAFNPGVVDNFTLYKGHIPAKYGGRISSVLQVDLKEGDAEKLNVEGSIGVISSRLVFDGPLGENTTFLLGGRTSYSDWVLSTVDDLDVRNSAARFHDINFGITQRLNENQKLKFTYFRSKDFFRFSDQFGFDYGNQVVEGEWEAFLNQNIRSNTILSYGQYRSSRFDPEGVDAGNIDNGINYVQLKENLKFTQFEKHDIDVGFQFVNYNSIPEVLTPRGEQSGIEPITVEKEQGREISLYADDVFDLSSKLTLSAGIRYTIFQNFGPYDVFQYPNDIPLSVDDIVDTTRFGNGEVIQTYDGLEPRIALRYQLTASSSVKMSYNRAFQYIHTVSNTVAQSPIDLWQLSNRYIQPQNSHNYSIGYFKNFSNNNWELSIDGFYKDINNLLEYRDFVNLLVNNHLETDLLAGRGRAFGGEFFIKRKKGRWSGWLSYTYSRSQLRIQNELPELRINNGDWYPTNFDRPHNLAVVSKLKVGKKSSFDVNANFTSGRPTNGIVSSFVVDGIPVPNFSERNQFRIPYYLRFDLAFTLADNIWKYERKKPKKYRETMTFAIYNVLSRANAYSVFFIRPEGTLDLPVPHRFAVLANALPSVTYNIYF